MAIIKTGAQEINENGVREISVNIENGDLAALNDIVSRYKFKDEASALRFALAVLYKAAGTDVVVNGEPISPGASLIEEASSGES
jgi:hypothetical protein